MKNNSLIFLFALLLLTACGGYTGKMRTIDQKTFEIQLPDWLEETNDLAPHAIFQFKSMYRNTYGIVVKNAKDNKSFEQYQQESVNVLRNFNELTNVLVTDSVYKPKQIALELMGDIESEKIFYWHNTYQDTDNYYQLVLWTRSYDRKQKYEPIIKDIIASFKMK